MLAQKSWQNAGVMRFDDVEASRKARAVVPSEKHPRGTQGPEVAVGAGPVAEVEEGRGGIPGVLDIGVLVVEEAGGVDDGGGEDDGEVDELVEGGAIVGDVVDVLRVVELLGPVPRLKA